MAKISTLIDDFSDNVIDASKWATSGSVAETGGRLVLTPQLNVAGQVLTISSYDLTASQITVDIPVITNDGSSGSLQSGLFLQINNNNKFGMRKVGSQLICSKIIAGTETQLAFTPYSATNHRYWRIRQTGNNVFLETSATGTGTFFVQFTSNVNQLINTSALFVQMFALFTLSEAVPGTMQIEAVNGGIPITASGASTSGGSAAILRLYRISASGASTSAGSVALSVVAPPPVITQYTASGASVSSGSASMIRLMVPELTGVALSVSTGSVVFIGTLLMTATAFSSSSPGFASITILPAPVDPDEPVATFTFEPPIVYDRPGVHKHTPRRVRQYGYYSRHSLGATGVSVLKLNGTYQSIQTPTVDDIASAEYVYQGGHIYTISQSEADALSAAGYTVTGYVPPPPPVSLHLFPAEDNYPAENLFPLA